MDRYELLVNVTAPGTMQDDHRYRDIAQAIIDFEPTSMIRLSIDDNSDDDQLLQQRFSLLSSDPTNVSSRCSASIILETPVQRLSTERSPKTRAPSVNNAYQSKPNPIGKHGQSGLLGAKPMLKINPPYRNPCHRLNQTVLTADCQFHQTPESGRPRTAPAATTPRLQVAFSDRVSRKRAHSDSSSFNSLLSAVSESQPLHAKSPSSRSDSSPTERFSWNGQTLSNRQVYLRSSSQPELTETIRIKRRRLTAESRVENVPQSAVEESLTPDVDGPFFLRDRDIMDWTSSSAPSVSQASTASVPSTVSPSQPILPTSFRAAAMQKRSHIDLSSPSKDPAIPAHCDPLTLSPASAGRTISISCPKGAFSKAPPPFQRSSNLPRSAAAPKTPLEINCPPPPTSSKKFRTHISSALSAITERLPLTRYFRPEFVRRDVNILERGYWRLPLAIANEQTVLRSRRSPNKTDSLELRRRQLSGSTVAARLSCWKNSREADSHVARLWTDQPHRRMGLWTDTEFFQFWESISAFIKDGKAGWGIRVVREDISRDDPSSSSNNGMDLVLKVFTWGEAVGHIYLALWVLSDKLVAYAPMEWVAADETVVLRMTGERHRQGQLGPWTRKGSEGEKGCWGIAIL